MLGQHRRRWVSIDTALAQRLVFVWIGSMYSIDDTRPTIYLLFETIHQYPYLTAGFIIYASTDNKLTECAIAKGQIIMV